MYAPSLAILAFVTAFICSAFSVMLLFSSCISVVRFWDIVRHWHSSVGNNFKSYLIEVPEANVYAFTKVHSFFSLLVNMTLLICFVVMYGQLFSYVVLALSPFCGFFVPVPVSVQVSREKEKPQIKCWQCHSFQFLDASLRIWAVVRVWDRKTLDEAGRHIIACPIIWNLNALSLRASLGPWKFIVKYR